jgi:threonine dehydrogenase-like Zn-dependent dehydrogenase
MKAIAYDDDTAEVRVVHDWPHPLEPIRDHEPIDSKSQYQALVKVKQVGICNTDLEICKGYVKGFRNVLGHEGVGVVEQIIDTRTREAVTEHELLSQRVVVEINCPCAENADAVLGHRVQSSSIPGDKEVFDRNHYPRRTVLGIIARDGLMAEYCLVPLDNCIPVPSSVSDTEAAFSEPLAAAYRIIEQRICNLDNKDERVAVVGDGKLGLLIAHVLVVSGCKHVWHFGRHKRKLDLIAETEQKVVGDDIPDGAIGSFDVAIEASGSPEGVKRAVELLRPMGTLVLKTTCSLDADPASLPHWSQLANDIVVNEKVVRGSRCGPQRTAVELLANDPRTKTLVGQMVDHVYDGLEEGLLALEHAGRRGSLKIMVRLREGTAV